MSARIPDQVRAAVVADIEAGQLSSHAIAARHGIGRTSVGRIADEAGIRDAFDRSRTAKATEAHRADCAALRAEMQQRLWTTAHELLDGVGHEVPVWGVGQFSDESGARSSRIVASDVRPGPAEHRQMMQAVSSATSQALAIARLDSENNGTEQVSGMLADMWQGMQRERAAREGTEQHGG